MAEVDPIQAQLIAARRNQILDAAIAVFAEKGFERATIRDVAKEAGIADGTIYNYFHNKTSLLIGILDRLNESSQRAADFEQSKNMNLRDWTREYIKHRMQVLNPTNMQVFRVLLSEVLVDKELREKYFKEVLTPTYDMAEVYFKQWAAEGSVKPVDPTLAMRAVSAMFLGLLMLHLMGDLVVQSQWDALLQDVTIQIILDGLGGSRE